MGETSISSRPKKKGDVIFREIGGRERKGRVKGGGEREEKARGKEGLREVEKAREKRG